MARCSGLKPTGEPCERIVGASQHYCYSHDPSRSEERHRNASKAARSKIGEVGEIKAQLRRVADGVLDGSIDTARGSVCAQLYGVLLRAIEAERRIRETDELQAQVEELTERFAT